MGGALFIWLVWNDNLFGKLLEQKKMVDEIDSLFPCLRILLLKNFAISMLVVTPEFQCPFPGCIMVKNCLLMYLRHKSSVFYNMNCWWLEDDNFATILNKLFDCHHPYGSIPSYTTNKYSCISRNPLQSSVKTKLALLLKWICTSCKWTQIFFYPYKTIMLFVEYKECQMYGTTTFVV